MRKAFLAIGSSLVLVLGFQNCGQVDPQSAAEAEIVAGISKVKAKDPDRFTIYDPENFRLFDVNLQSGQMQSYNDFGDQVGPIYCLSEGELGVALAILNNSEICEPQFDPDALKDRVCAMSYLYPYASLSYSGTEYKLGEKNSDCDVPVDLCGDRKSQLKAWSQMVVRTIEDHQCQ